MTLSLAVFHKAISDARELLELYEALNCKDGIVPPDALKKASLVLALTAWETYVEDVATEVFQKKFSLIEGSKLGKFAQKHFDERLRSFHNPNSLKTKHLFEEFFDTDITEFWAWNNVLPKDAREQLNKWISKRGEAVHRATVEINTPQIIKKDELTKCLRFFVELVKATDVAAENL